MAHKSGYCPACDADRELEIKVVEQIFPVKGEPVKIEAEVAYCTVCGEEVPDHILDSAALERAYAKYRRLKDVPTPDQLKALRVKYGLGQRSLAKLLGWSPATVYRYEKGAIPVPAHAETIRRLTDPEEMTRLLERHADKLTSREFSRVREKMRSLDNQGAIALNAVEKWAGALPISAESGYRRFDFDKLLNMILFFVAKKRMSKTSLMKHLWYADFLHFKKHGVSISGARYAALPHGPALEKWMLCLQAAAETGAVTVESVLMRQQEADLVCAQSNVDETVFTPEEMATLKEVARRLGGFDANALSRRAHDEDAWKLTPKNGMISYEHAATLRWPPENHGRSRECSRRTGPGRAGHCRVQ